MSAMQSLSLPARRRRRCCTPLRSKCTSGRCSCCSSLFSFFGQPSALPRRGRGSTHRIGTFRPSNYRGQSVKGRAGQSLRAAGSEKKDNACERGFAGGFFASAMCWGAIAVAPEVSALRHAEKKKLMRRSLITRAWMATVEVMWAWQPACMRVSS